MITFTENINNYEKDIDSLPFIGIILFYYTGKKYKKHEDFDHLSV